MRSRAGAIAEESSGSLSTARAPIPTTCRPGDGSSVITVQAWAKPSSASRYPLRRSARPTNTTVLAVPSGGHDVAAPRASVSGARASEMTWWRSTSMPAYNVSMSVPWLLVLEIVASAAIAVFLSNRCAKRRSNLLRTLALFDAASIAGVLFRTTSGMSPPRRKYAGAYQLVASIRSIGSSLWTARTAWEKYQGATRWPMPARLLSHAGKPS